MKEFDIDNFEIKGKEIIVYIEFMQNPYEGTIYINTSKFEDWLESNDKLQVSYTYSGDFGEPTKVSFKVEKEDYLKTVESWDLKNNIIDYIKENYINEINDIIKDRNILSRIGKITKLEKVERRIKQL